jgi:hypothetical protein
VNGEHFPGATDIWKNFEVARDTLPKTGGRGIGTPDEMRVYLREFAEAGVDQVTFIQQAGRNRHEHICESIEIFARDVMPEFKEFEAERQKKKMEELAPYIEAAMKRKQYMKAVPKDQIPGVLALNRQIAEQRAPGVSAEQAERERRVAEESLSIISRGFT